MVKKINSDVPGLGWLIFLQTALLVLSYGFNVILPLWVLWFPFIILGVAITIIIIIVVAIALWEAYY